MTFHVHKYSVAVKNDLGLLKKKYWRTVADCLLGAVGGHSGSAGSKHGFSW